VGLERAGLGEALVADAARKRTFTCVCAHVRTQVPDLGKCFVADRTDERLLAEVHRSLVPTQAPAELEPHRALGAGKRLFGTVDALVPAQVAQHYERPSAFVAAEPSDAAVDCQVGRQKAGVPELAAAVRADVRRGVGVGPGVVLQSTGLCKSLVAARHLAHIRTLTGVYPHVHYQHGCRAEPPTTDTAHVLTIGHQTSSGHGLSAVCGSGGITSCLAFQVLPLQF